MSETEELVSRVRELDRLYLAWDKALLAYSEAEGDREDLRLAASAAWVEYAALRDACPAKYKAPATTVADEESPRKKWPCPNCGGAGDCEPVRGCLVCEGSGSVYVTPAEW